MYRQPWLLQVIKKWQKMAMHAIVQSCTCNLPEIDGKDRPLPRSMNIQLPEHFYMEEDDNGHKQYQIRPCDHILAKVLAVTDLIVACCSHVVFPGMS